MNSNAVRAFIVLVLNTWFPILYALGVFPSLDKEIFGAIQTGIVVTVTAFFGLFQPDPSA